ncbi:MAG: DUF1538 domain-containing protein [Mariprofundaceae bacterium]|nr:DUF1538 domain-containing protein [Mariprofundaceae bacterium]
MNEFLNHLLLLLWSTTKDVLPIILTLFFFQYVILKQPIAHIKQVFKGLLFVIIGLAIFLVGLQGAIFPLGDAMAKQLTDPYFLYGDSAGQYLWSDYGWVYLFGFSIGFATTLAEPALIAVAFKVHEISAGSISALGLRIAVALGVAVGVSIGCFRIVTGEPLWVFIIIAYILVIIQTFFAPKSMIPLAYDSGGVTTSTVTVPLLAALGLGLASTIPGRDPMVDGFGLIAFASVFPIISVLLYAQISSFMEKCQKGKK